MRDNHYRNLCTDPSDYDRVIDWVKSKTNGNTKCNCQHDHLEEVASTIVNNCISAIIYNGAKVSEHEFCIGLLGLFAKTNKRKVILRCLKVG